MKLKAFLACAAALATLVSGERVTFAGLTATIVNPTNGGAIAVHPGESFQVKVRLTGTSNPLASGQFKVQEVTGSGRPVQSGFFTLNSAVFADAWDGGLNPTPQMLSSPTFASGVFGATAADSGGVLAPSDMLALDITLSPAATHGSSYYLNLTDLVFADTDLAGVDALAGTPFEVTAVPAPAAALLGLIGLGAVGWIKNRMPVVR